MNRIVRLTLATLQLSTLLVSGGMTAMAASSDESVEFGQRIYRDGTLSSGASLVARVNGDVEVTGEQVTCGACHRRSGLGSSEGADVVPAITGPILMNPLQLPASKPPAPPVLRPAYTRETLATAIREGHGADGSELGPLMPRYPLSDDDMGFLIDYLESLDTGPAPGVTAEEIHFASIIAGDVDPAARKALVDVLTTFAGQKNTETRYETKRASSGPWHKDWIFKPYRKWVIHVWDVTGPESSWRDQLEAFYEERPVFAVLNGLSPGAWQPVHDFCQDNEMPCLFPTTNVPVVDEEVFFNLYLSRGVALEADSIASLIARDVIGGKVVQVFDPASEATRAAAAAFGKDAPFEIASIALDDLADRRFTSDEITLVAWLDGDGLARLSGALPDEVDLQTTYLSGSLLGAAIVDVNERFRDSAVIVSSKEFAIDTRRLLMRSTGWFRARRIHSPEHEEIQANAYFALKVAGSALVTIRGFFSREYFIESIEHMIDNATYTSVYPYMSLAPDQRFVSKGTRVARFDDNDPKRLVAIDDWLIPDPR